MEQFNERSYLHIYIAGRELANLELLSKSDPFCNVYYTLENELEQDLGKTETIYNNLDPSWEKSFKIDYLPELTQKLRFVVYDKNWQDNSFMGEVSLYVRDIMLSQNELLKTQLKKKEKDKGKFYVKAVKVRDSNHFATLKFTGINLVNLDGIFNNSDPYLKIYSIRGGVNCLIHRSETRRDNLNPIWDPIEVSLELLCSNDDKMKFKIECHDEDDGGRKSKLMGYFETSIDEIFNQKIDTFNLIQGKKSGGTIKLVQFSRVLRPNFQDHLSQGLVFNILIGIDYSATNGAPSFADSLHFFNKEKENQYSSALKDVLQIVSQYDKKFAVYGLSAEPHLENHYMQSTEGFFPLTGDFSKPIIQGVDNTLTTYWESLRKIDFKCVLSLQPYIEYTKEIAKLNAQKQIYTISVILTCGQVDDQQATMASLVSSSQFPISTIFVGIGQLDFLFLKNLNQRCKEISNRSNIHFTPHIKYPKLALMRKYMTSQIPDQVVEFKK